MKLEVAGSGQWAVGSRRPRTVAAVYSLCFWAVLSGQVSWGAAGGTAAAPVLNMGMGARPLAMAGAFTGVADDVNALFYNPAGLGGLRSVQASAQYQKWLGGAGYSHLGAVLPIPRIGTFGVSGMYFGTPAIDAFDEFGNAQGSYKTSDLAFGLSYGRRLAGGLSGGLTAKFLQESLAELSAGAFSADLGVLYKLNPKVQAGLFAGNLGSSLKQISEAASQASMVRLGLSGLMLQEKLLGALDFTKQFDDDPELRIGTEYRKDLKGGESRFAARLGYRLEFGGAMIDGLTGLSGGVGFGHGPLKLDYAFSLWGQLGSTHVFSLGFQGSGSGASVAPEKAPQAKGAAPKKPSPRTQAKAIPAAKAAGTELKAPSAAPSAAAPASGLSTGPSAEQRMKEATELMKASKVQEGLAILDELVRAETVDPRAHLYRGIALKRLDRKAEALKSFKAALAASAEGSNVRAAAQKYLEEFSSKKSAP